MSISNSLTTKKKNDANQVKLLNREDIAQYEELIRSSHI